MRNLQNTTLIIRNIHPIEADAWLEHLQHWFWKLNLMHAGLKMHCYESREAGSWHSLEPRSVFYSPCECETSYSSSGWVMIAFDDFTVIHHIVVEIFHKSEPHGGAWWKVRITKVIRIHPLGTKNACKKCHGSHSTVVKISQSGTR